MRRQIDNAVLDMALVGLNAKRDELIRKVRLILGASWAHIGKERRPPVQEQRCQMLRRNPSER
jgi:hypothetical protein